MTRDALHDRGHALEEAFFQKREAELLAKLRERRDHEHEVRELAHACGIRDERVLSTLLEMGIRAETVPALALVPLVAIAWAGGDRGASERQAVLEAAEEAGISRDEPGFALLESWLEVRPPQALFRAWLDFTAEFREQLDDEQRAALRDDFVERARRVAQVAGGVLNLGPHVSKEEREILERIADAI